MANRQNNQYGLRSVLVVFYLLFWCVLNIGFAQGIHADKLAPKHQQATILKAANGTPQINIQTPTRAGVSVNQYTQFDVGQGGAILNNSRQSAMTQLGGWVQGNPWLAKGEARIIVNQVNASKPSSLNGYMEVAGRRAEVVIANPSGIHVDGAGWINASGVTLTTGNPRYESGALSGFDVRSGNIQIGAKGLDTHDADYTRILAQSTQIQGAIWAKDIRLLTGQYELATKDGRETMVSTMPTTYESFAIDTSELGGMYAHSITLVSTAPEATVRHQGQIFASAGHVEIDVNGHLINSGTIAVDQGQTSDHQSPQLLIRSDSLDNSGTISAKEQVQIESGSIRNSGTMLSSGALELKATQELNHEVGAHIQAERLAIQATELNNAGTITQTGSQTLRIEAKSTLDNRGTIGISDPNLMFSHDSHDSIDSHTTSDIALMTPSTAIGVGHTTLGTSIDSNTQTLPSLEDGMIISHHLFNHSGHIRANGQIEVRADRGLNNTGQMVIARLRVQGDLLDNQNGKIISDDAQIHTHYFNNQNGLLTTAQTLHIQTEHLDNHHGSLSSVGSATLAVFDYLNNTQQGEIMANQSLRIEDGQRYSLVIDNTDGLLQSQDELNIQSRALNNQGVIQAGNLLDIRLKDSFTVRRNLTAGKHLNLSSMGSLINYSALKAGQTLSLQADKLMNQASGSIQAGQTIQAVARHEFSNRGVLNSQGLSYLSAGERLLNLGKGKIYGDHVALLAHELINQEEKIDQETQAGVIAARMRLDLGASKIFNQESAILSSQGDLAIGGDLDSQHHATGMADYLRNASARIEAQGNASMAVKQLENINTHFLLESYLATPVTKIRDYTVIGKNTYYQSSKDGYFDDSRGKKDQTIAMFHLKSGEHIAENQWHVRDYQAQTYKQRVVESQPAMIIVGGNLTASGQTWVNQNSQIMAAGHLIVDALDEGRISNEATLGQGYIENLGTQWDSVTRRQWYKWAKRPRRVTVNQRPYHETIQFTHEFDTAISIIQQNTLLNTQAETSVPLSDRTILDLTADVVSIDSQEIQLPNSHLYTVYPDAKGVLVETDPAFTNYRQWLGSDYLLKALNLDPNQMHKRLGDGYYEQTLINEQIQRLTGFRRLEGYRSDEEQFQALMDSGVTAAKVLGLTPGVALTADQVARLTSDIVWLEKQTVTLADGRTQTVLVPKVYVFVRQGDVHHSGALISADQVRLNVQNGTLENSGTIAGRQAMLLDMRDIQHSGYFQADKIGLNAQNKISFKGGVARANRFLLAQADQIHLHSTTMRTGDQHNGNTILDRVAALYLKGNHVQDGASLVLYAKDKLSLQAAMISNEADQGLTHLSAGNDLNMGTVEVQHHETFGDLAEHHYRHVHQTEEVGSRLESRGDILIQAGNDLSIRQGEINSQIGQVVLESGRDIELVEGRKTLALDASVHTSVNHILSKTQTLDQYQARHDEAVATVLTGKMVSMKAANHALVRGSQVISDMGTTLFAGQDVSIIAAQNHLSDRHHHELKRSGLMGTGGLGMLLGQMKTRYEMDQSHLIHTASTVGSLKGHTSIVAGKHYRQLGSVVSSPEGDQSILAQSIDIEAVQNHHAGDLIQTYEQKGLAFALHIPILSEFKRTTDVIQKIGKHNNTRTNTMAAANAGWQSYQLSESIQSQGKESKSSGVRIAVTYGQQKNRSQLQYQISEAQASLSMAGGQNSLIATGAGTQSNIQVKGSEVIGKSGTTLIADHQVDLLSVEQTRHDRTWNQSTGWNAGAAISLGQNGWAFGVTAGGNLGRGNADSSAISHFNSHVGDKQSRTIVQSGADTLIKGTQLIGKSIQVDAKNLVIESQQDRETYASKQFNIQAQVTVGYGASVEVDGGGNLAYSKVKADHASVREQSGIYAGDDGYQVSVDLRTQLKGGIITSSQNAESQGKNHLSTASLVFADIENYSRYKGQSLGLGVQMSFGKGGAKENQTSNQSSDSSFNASSMMGYGLDSDKQKSITRSGVNTHNIHITDAVAQQKATGLTVENTKFAIHTDTTTQTAAERSMSLSNRFDREAVQKELNLQREISQDFSHNVQQAYTKIAHKAQTYSDQAEKLSKAAIRAERQGDVELAEALSHQAMKEQTLAMRWQRSGVLLNMIASGLSAPTQSTTGMMTATMAPAASYGIGQYFKNLVRENNATGQTANLTLSQTGLHLATHAVLGGIVSGASGQNIWSGAMSAAVAEGLAPSVGQWISPKDSHLTSRQKGTVSAITSVLGAGIGLATGQTASDAMQGALSAGHAVQNNWLTLEEIQDFRHKHAQLLQLSEKSSYRKAVKKLYAETAKLSEANRQRTQQNCRNQDSSACQSDIKRMTEGYHYIANQSYFSELADELQGVGNTTEGSETADEKAEVGKILVQAQMTKNIENYYRTEYEDREDIRFFEYENLRDIADFASNEAKRKEIEAYLGSKDYQYTTQPFWDKPYVQMYVLPIADLAVGMLQGGAGAAISTTGLGFIPGVLAIMSSIDDAVTSISNLGVEPAKQQASWRIQALQKLGMSQEGAETVAFGIDSLLNVNPSGFLKSIQKKLGKNLAVGDFKHISTKVLDHQPTHGGFLKKYTYDPETQLYRGANGGLSKYVGDNTFGRPIMQRMNADGSPQYRYYIINKEGKQVSTASPYSSSKEWTVANSDLKRPYLRTSTVEHIKGKYTKLPNGDYIRKSDGDIVKGPDVHIGHRTDFENRRVLKAAEELGMTQKQLTDFVNHPDYVDKIFELQNAAENVSHKFELPGYDRIDKIKQDMLEFLKRNGK